MDELPNLIQEALAGELADLERSADQLEKAITQHNYLPNDFPVEQVRLVCSNLTGLSYGSADGVALQLEFASSKLSEIRRQFFPINPHTPEIDENDEEPALCRNDSLDTQFVLVISSISTSLAAYRENTRGDYQSFNTQEFSVLTPNQDEAGDKRFDIKNNISEIDDLGKIARSAEWKAEKKIADVGIYSADARNALTAMRAELSSKTVAPAWLRRLSGYSSKVLKVLSTSLDILRAGAGLAKEFSDRFDRTISKIKDNVIEEGFEWLSWVSEKVDRSEQRLRNFSQVEKAERAVGVIRAVGSGQRVVITPEQVPFTIDINERYVPQIGKVVEFDAKQSNGILAAHNIKESKTFTIVDNRVLTLREALPVFHLVTKSFLAPNPKQDGPVSIGSLLKRIARSSRVPSDFWLLYGYKNFSEFVKEIPDVFTLDIGYASFASLSPIRPPELTIEQLCEWCVSKLATIEGPVEIGQLAVWAREHFALGAFQVKTVLRVNKFSDALATDPRIKIDKSFTWLVDKTADT